MNIQTKNERIGINEVSTLCVREGWLMRELFVKDYGIDATIEYYDEKEKISRNLLALQIKSGSSYFKEKEKNNYVFRFDERLKKYWASFLMPVVLVLYDISRKKAIYTIINDKNTISTGNGYKVLVDDNMEFSSFLKKEAISVKKMPEYIYNYNYMLSHLELMKSISEGYDVVLRAHEWINKSSGRGHISIWIFDKNRIIDILDWNYWYPFQLYEIVISKLFPWADFVPDDKFLDSEYDIQDCSELIRWHSNNVEKSYSDEVEKRAAQIKSVVRAGEVAFYELHLHLNEFGESFLNVHSNLNDISVYKEIEIQHREKLEYSEIEMEDIFKMKHR